MAGTVLTAAALSALLHALWNILARQHSRPSDCLYGITVATSSLCLFILPLCGLPELGAWPWLIAASVLNVVYLHVLGRAYAQDDFCAVYGIVRATVPAVLFLIGALYFEEKTGLAAQAGLASIIVSILVFASAGGLAVRLGYRTIARSLFAGLILAAAIVADVQGIRLTGDTFKDLLAYAAASSLLTAFGVFAVTTANRSNVIAVLRNDTIRCYSGAVLLLAAYLLGMWAYAQGPIGLVAPVRESSILVAGALAILILRDKITSTQWAAMLLASVGIVLVRAG